MFKLPTNLRRLRPQTETQFKLPFPAPPNLRIAQLGDGPAFAGVQPFVAERRIELEAYRPQVIVGRAKDMQMVAEMVELRMLDLSSMDHATVVITECGDEPLSDVARVVLWQTFGVPVFEIFTGRDFSVLAAECELHEGWHLEEDVEFDLVHGQLVLDAPGNTGLQTGLLGRIDYEPCPCGRPAPRLMNIRPARKMPQSSSVRLAATA
jgi:phenylacetate-coenzyme A ligase PaaK-like adenylate-forming protein